MWAPKEIKALRWAENCSSLPSTDIGYDSVTKHPCIVLPMVELTRALWFEASAAEPLCLNSVAKRLPLNKSGSWMRQQILSRSGQSSLAIHGPADLRNSPGIRSGPGAFPDCILRGTWSTRGCSWSPRCWWRGGRSTFNFTKMLFFAALKCFFRGWGYFTRLQSNNGQRALADVSMSLPKS